MSLIYEKWRIRSQMEHKLYTTNGSNPNIYSAKLNLNFHPLEVMSRYRDTQLQVGKNYSYLPKLRTNISKSCFLNTHCVPNNSD